MTPPDQSALAEYLRYLAYRGAIERYGLPPETFETALDDIESELDEGLTTEEDWPGLAERRRIDHELDVIGQAGFPGYFLIVADLLRFCREAGIPTGPGRGSVCGSVVAYVTGITDVDPLRWGIPFERFLHLERIAMPDVDLDVCQSRRQEVIEYLRGRYGTENVAQIVTFGTLMAKGVVKDVCRILHVDDLLYGTPGNHTGAKLSEMIPEGSGADQVKLAEFVGTEAGAPLLQAMQGLAIEAFGRRVEVLDTCLRLEGIRKHSSVHAAGVVIADRPLIELAPLYRRNRESEIQVSYDMRDLEEIGLLKFDVLGLRTVTVIGDAEALVRRRLPGFAIKEVPLDDDAAYRLLREGRTGGVFQLEGDGITAAVQGIAPDRFEDIVALLALYRPGPMEQLGTYVDRKHGREQVSYAHPDLEPVLRSTYGLIVFQEQVMGIVRALGGYTAGEADMFRKAIGKKLPELIRAEIATFTGRAEDRGHDPRVIAAIAEQIAYFGRYGFNLGHATGYAYLTYWTAYLKANHPTEWYCALLNSHADDAGKLAAVLREADVEVLAPDINRSGERFTIDAPGVVRFGLAAVKGLGETAARQIVDERDSDRKQVYVSRKEERWNEEKQKHYTANLRVLEEVANDPRPYAGVDDFCRRLPSIPSNVKQALVAAGAFTTDLEERRRLHAAMPKLNEAAKKGRAFDWRAVEPEMSELELIRAEREVMGLYVTGHPLAMQRGALDQYGAVYDGDWESLPGTVTVAGLVVDVKTVKTRTKGEEMAFLTLENGIQGMPRVTVFPSTWRPVAHALHPDAVVVVRGVRQEHAKFGASLNAEQVRVLDRARPDARLVRLVLPAAEVADVLRLQRLLREWEDEAGVRYQVVLDGHDRIALLAPRGRAILTAATMEQALAEGWEIALDPASAEVRLAGRRLRERPPFAGRDRLPAWEHGLIKYAMDRLDAAFILELGD